MIVGLTVVVAGAAISQFFIFQGQLQEMRATREGAEASTADQMAVMRDQAKAMQGQLDQMQAAQRPWLLVDGMSVSGIEQFPVGSGITAFARYKLTNLGRSPATAIFIKTALILKSLDKFDAGSVRKLCLPQPTSEDDRILAEYSDTVLPGQTETIGGIGDAASFSHSIKNIDAERDAANKAAQDAATKAGIPNAITNKPTKGWGTLFITPTLVGCVTYKTPGSDVTHETGFAFDARNGFFSNIPVEVGQKGTIFDGRLDVTPSSIGNFAN